MIVGFEVGSRAQYEKLYHRPEWPGGQSGVTVAIGYDLGYVTRDKIAADFAAYVPSAMLVAMQNVAGLTGTLARDALDTVKNKVSISWDAAMAVFEKVDLPRYEQQVLRACPGSEKLNGDCFGVLASIAYNRGAGGFTMSGDRFSEMRIIRADIASGNLQDVPNQIRRMKRLWEDKGLPGLLTRRDAEARMFEAGLTNTQPLPDFLNPKPVTPAGSDLNVQVPTAKYDAVVEAAQKNLSGMNYHEVGDIDGMIGGKTRAAVTAFMTDRGKSTVNGELTPDVIAEINQAVAEKWSRPIAPQRANATAKDIARKVASVNQTWWQKLWATVLGIPTAVATVFKSIFGEQGSPSDYVEPVRNFFASIPAELYMLAVAVICIAVFIQAKRSQDATVAAYRKGEIN